MSEAIFAGAVLAIVLRWLSRSAKEPTGFVRHFSRGAYMRDMNLRHAILEASA
jgi:hypothetical protein